jgi:hypothetical protein
MDAEGRFLHATPQKQFKNSVAAAMVHSTALVMLIGPTDCYLYALRTSLPMVEDFLRFGKTRRGR